VANQWFEERKDLFFRDLVHSFLESKIFFDDLYQYYKNNDTFRKSESKINLSEYLFDWTLGSIFHEGMKLKEDVYQLEVYLPSHDKIDTSKGAEEIEEVLEEYFAVIDKATRNLDAEMESMKNLFLKAVGRLKELLTKHAHNGFLLENKKLVEKALGRNSLKEIISSLYPDQSESAYFIAGKSCLKGGWFKEAKEYFKKALEINPNCTDIKKHLKEAEQKLSPGRNE